LVQGENFAQQGGPKGECENRRKKSTGANKKRKKNGTKAEKLVWA